MSSIAFLDKQVQAGNSGTATIAIPASAIAGAVAIVEFEMTTIGAPALVTPAGWTLVDTGLLAPSSAYQTMLFAKVLVSGDLGGTHTAAVTLDASHKWSGVLGMWTGCDISSGLATAIASASYVTETGTASATHAAPVLTVPSDQGGYALVQGYGDRGSPASQTLAYSPGTLDASSSPDTGTGGYMLGIGHQLAVASGSSTGSFTSGAALLGRKYSIVLRPSSSTAATSSSKVSGHWPKYKLDSALLRGTPKLALMQSAYAFDRDAHIMWSDVSASELAHANGYTAPVALPGVATSYDSANDRVLMTGTTLTITPTGTLAGFQGAYVYLDTGTPSTSPLMFFLDPGSPVSSAVPINFIPDPVLGWHAGRVAVGS